MVDNIPTAPDLPSCLFCRGEAEMQGPVFGLIRDDKPAVWVECLACGAESGVFDGPEEAAAAWSARAPLDPAAMLAAGYVPAAEVAKARQQALEEVKSDIKETIATIVYDGWYKQKWPVTSHGYQKVQEECDEAIQALMNTKETDDDR